MANGTREIAHLVRAEGAHKQIQPRMRGIRLWQATTNGQNQSLPFFGCLEKHPNIVYGHGYCGNGVGPSFTGAKFLASLALDRKDEWATSPLAQGPHGRRFPPEPLRYVGANLVRDAAGRIERAQDEGRKSRALDKALARFAPEGLVRTDN